MFCSFMNRLTNTQKYILSSEFQQNSAKSSENSTTTIIQDFEHCELHVFLSNGFKTIK